MSRESWINRSRIPAEVWTEFKRLRDDPIRSVPDAVRPVATILRLTIPDSLFTTHAFQALIISRNGFMPPGIMEAVRALDGGPGRRARRGLCW